MELANAQKLTNSQIIILLRDFMVLVLRRMLNVWSRTATYFPF